MISDKVCQHPFVLSLSFKVLGFGKLSAEKQQMMWADLVVVVCL